MNLSRAPKDYALLLGLAMIWSGSFVFIKIGVDTVGPLTLTAARLGIAAGVLYLWLRINGERLPRDRTSLKIFAFIGLFGNALPFTLISWGEIHIDSGLTAVLMGVMPVATAVLAHLFIRDEPFTTQTAIGISIGFGGLLILIGAEARAGLTAPILAQLAVITSAICYGASATFARYYAGHGSGRVMATGAMLAGLLWMLPATLILEQPWQMHPGMGGFAAIAYLGLLPTALAALLFFYLIPRLGANNFAQINYLIPVLGALWGVIFLGETASWRLLTALALVLAAITIVRKRLPNR